MEHKKIAGIIHAYSKKTRDQILTLAASLFRQAGIVEFVSDVFSCVDELIKNAVKSNYKYVLIVNKIQEQVQEKHSQLSEKEVIAKVQEIVKDKRKYEELAADIVESDNISQIVRKILNEEAIQLRLKNKIYTERRNYTEEELEKLATLKQLQMMRKELAKRDVKVLIKVETDGEFLYVEVTNNAPIMEKDLNRIHEKRNEFRSYRGTGREYEFFMNNLDTSESGFGLGYATVDSFLCNLGLNPDQSIQLLAAADTTILLTLPIKELRKDALLERV